MQVWPLGQEDPLEKEMATHSSILAWGIPWTEDPGGVQSMGSKRVRYDWSALAHAHRVLETGPFTDLPIMSINRSKCSYQLLFLVIMPPHLQVTVTKMHTDWNSVSPVLSERDSHASKWSGYSGVFIPKCGVGLWKEHKIWSTEAR